MTADLAQWEFRGAHEPCATCQTPIPVVVPPTQPITVDLVARTFTVHMPNCRWLAAGRAAATHPQRAEHERPFVGEAGV